MPHPGPWHQRIELDPGEFTRPLRPGEKQVTLAREFALIGGMRNRSLLDIACNAGAHCVEALRAGARFAHGIDARKQWIEQAQYVRDRLGFEHVWKISRGNVDGPWPDISANPSVVLLKGILYHVADPLGMLRRACSLANHALIVNTACAPPGAQNGFSLKMESPRPGDRAGLHSLAPLTWLPSGPAVIAEILNHHGFSTIDHWRRDDTGPGRAPRCQVIAVKRRLPR
jgi:hypothetical protein